VSGSAVPEELAKLVQVLAEDGDLRAWFDSLAGTPDDMRSEELREIAARMKAAGEHPELIQATALLAEPHIYQAVRLTLGQAAD
jgi:hypothetical protein